MGNFAQDNRNPGSLRDAQNLFFHTRGDTLLRVRRRANLDLQIPLVSPVSDRKSYQKISLYDFCIFRLQFSRFSR